MALVKFDRGNKSALPSTFEDGKIYVTSDTEELFVDVSNSKRVQIIDFVTVETEGDLPLAPLDKFYYVKQTHKIKRYQDGSWVDTGGVSNYTELSGKPSIGGTTLEGSLLPEDLGLQPSGNYLEADSIDVNQVVYWQNASAQALSRAAVQEEVTVESHPLTYWQNITGMWNTVCKAGNGTYELTMSNAGMKCDLAFFTLRFIAPNDYQEGYTFTFEGNVYEPAKINGFEKDQVVLLNFNLNNKKCYS